MGEEKTPTGGHLVHHFGTYAQNNISFFFYPFFISFFLLFLWLDLGVGRLIRYITYRRCYPLLFGTDHCHRSGSCLRPWLLCWILTWWGYVLMSDDALILVQYYPYVVARAAVLLLIRPPSSQPCPWCRHCYGRQLNDMIVVRLYPSPGNQTGGWEMPHAWSPYDW